MKRSLALFFFLLSLCGCGYHFQQNREKTTISVDPIGGDFDGLFMKQLVHALSASGNFTFSQKSANVQLALSILSDTDDRIGYRYDRNPTTGKLRKNIVGTENRQTIQVEVKLIDSYTQQILLGPQTITASADYDYVDSYSIKDLVFFVDDKPTTVIDFSLGQLDSIEGAHDDARVPIFHKLAQMIVDGLQSLETIAKLGEYEAS